MLVIENRKQKIEFLKMENSENFILDYRTWYFVRTRPFHVFIYKQKNDAICFYLLKHAQTEYKSQTLKGKTGSGKVALNKRSASGTQLSLTSILPFSSG